MPKQFADISRLHPQTDAQVYANQLLQDETSQINFLIGPAGTGKTLLALYNAVLALKSSQTRQIYYIKPIVDMQELKGIGFLPGGEDEKLAPILWPVRDNLSVFCKDGLAKYMIEKQDIQPMLFQDMRGRSFNNCWVIIDECQNASIAALKMALTRIGKNTKMVILGDPSQRDVQARIAGPEPLSFAMEHLTGIEGIDFAFFHREDIVRNGLIKEVLERFEFAAQTSS